MINSVSFKGVQSTANQQQVDKKKIAKNVAIVAGVAVATGAMYLLGKGSPKFTVLGGGMGKNGVMWDGPIQKAPFFKAVKEGFVRLPKLCKKAFEIVKSKECVLDNSSKYTKIKGLLKDAFSGKLSLKL